MPLLSTSHLGIGLVLYQPDLPTLRTTLSSLQQSLLICQQNGLIQQASVVIVDHSPQPLTKEQLEGLVSNLGIGSEPYRYRHYPDNPGFGSGMNHCFTELPASTDVFLVCNPDLLFAPDSLSAGLRALHNTSACLIAPALETPQGKHPACFREPTLWTLFLRSFAPASLKQHHADTLRRYAYLDHPGDQPLVNPELVSGCCMLVSAAAFRAVGGFDARYFMYFEDFELSRRLREYGGSYYCPEMLVRHFGGNASRKSSQHIRWFIGSALRYFVQRTFNRFR